MNIRISRPMTKKSVLGVQSDVWRCSLGSGIQISVKKRNNPKRSTSKLFKKPLFTGYFIMKIKRHRRSNPQWHKQPSSLHLFFAVYFPNKQFLFCVCWINIWVTCWVTTHAKITHTHIQRESTRWQHCKLSPKNKCIQKKLSQKQTEIYLFIWPRVTVSYI